MQSRLDSDGFEMRPVEFKIGITPPAGVHIVTKLGQTSDPDVSIFVDYYSGSQLIKNLIGKVVALRPASDYDVTLSNLGGEPVKGHMLVWREPDGPLQEGEVLLTEHLLSTGRYQTVMKETRELLWGVNGRSLVARHQTNEVPESLRGITSHVSFRGHFPGLAGDWSPPQGTIE